MQCGVLWPQSRLVQHAPPSSAAFQPPQTDTPHSSTSPRLPFLTLSLSPLVVASHISAFPQPTLIPFFYAHVAPFFKHPRFTLLPLFSNRRKSNFFFIDIDPTPTTTEHVSIGPQTQRNSPHSSTSHRPRDLRHPPPHKPRITSPETTTEHPLLLAQTQPHETEIEISTPLDFYRQNRDAAGKGEIVFFACG